MQAVEERSSSTANARDASVESGVIIVATDGTAQSQPALSFAAALGTRVPVEVRVITVVDESPIPWGVVDRDLIIEYERGLLKDALDKVRTQVAEFGSPAWAVEVQTGNPATRINAYAEKGNARLVVVGLGGHGATARLFGSETALRLVRTSRVPVLAVAPKLNEAPRRILVAMDFSEASIEAARLSLELAAKDATMVLAHVVPWERREYIPETWFRAHESAVGGELTRVSRWLDEERRFRVSHRILYGRTASSLLSYANELGADLIVCGTHGRGAGARLLGGETVAKVIRGAQCSVLVLPAAAAFKLYDRLRLDDAVAGGKDWVARLDDFSRKNMARRGRLEVDDANVGAQVEMSGYRFLGASFEPETRRATLMFGDTSGTGPHLVRGISNVRSVEILRNNGRDVALAVGNDEGQTLLVFDEATPTDAGK